MLGKNLPLVSVDEQSSEELSSIFEKLGIVILRNLPSFVSDHASVMGNYILRTGVLDILEGLRRLDILSGHGDLKKTFRTLSTKEKVIFRKFVVTELQLSEVGMST